MREINLNHQDFAALSADVLARKGSLPIKAHGFSMYPFIRNGDIICIQPSGINAFRVGEVVLYHSDEEKLVAHRIIGRRLKNGRIFLRMCGDATLDFNDWIPAGHVLGRVAAILRGHRVLRLDKGLMRVLSVFWARSFPAGHFFFRLLCVAQKAIVRRNS
jgi:signal peptidase I